MHSSKSSSARLASQSIGASGDFPMAATGSATSPTLFLLDNNYSGSLATNQAAVRL